MKNAGYKILELHPTNSLRETTKGFALAKAISKKAPCQWVTWRYTEPDDDGRPDFFSGNYHCDEQSARADLHQRISDFYKTTFTKTTFENAHSIGCTE